MATQVRKLPPSKGKTPKYDWKKWANGRPWIINQGVDFKCDADAMRQSLYAYARRMKLTVVVRRQSEQSLAFQFQRPAKKGGR